MGLPSLLLFFSWYHPLTLFSSSYQAGSSLPRSWRWLGPSVDRVTPQSHCLWSRWEQPCGGGRAPSSPCSSAREGLESM